MLALVTLAGIGLAAGLLSGLFGVGGGFVLVPLLVLAGWALPQAIGTSLFYVVAMGLGGALSHFRHRNLDVAFVAKFLLPAMVGAQLGARLVVLFPEPALAIAFAVFLAFLARTMGQPTPSEPNAATSAGWGRILGVGGGVGLLSGLFGVGGGVLFVPAQARLFGVELKRAVGNSMFLVLLVGISGMAGHAMLGTVVWEGGAAAIAGGLVGLRLGLWGLRRTSSEALRRYLVAFLAAMAFYMAGRGAWAWWWLAGPRA